MMQVEYEGKEGVGEARHQDTDCIEGETSRIRRGDEVSMSQADDFLVKIQEAESQNS